MREQAKGSIYLEPWMCTELGLKGNELIAYAVVYSYTNADEFWLCGARQVIADWAGCSTKTASRVLASLVEKGLVRRRTRTENGVAFNDYQTVRV